MRARMEQGRGAKVRTVTIDSWGDVGRVVMVAIAPIIALWVLFGGFLMLDALIRAGR